MALDTVQEYVDAARALLQDTVDAPYRYSTVDIVDALNIGFLEAYRLRPDLFIGVSVPEYSAGSLGTTVVMTNAYRAPIVFFTVAHVQLRDDEETQDSRAAQFMSKFVSSMQSAPS
jgi:hypothetical protein